MSLVRDRFWIDPSGLDAARAAHRAQVAWDNLEPLRYGACLSAETVLAQYDENDKESLAEAMEILRDSLAKVKAAEERYTRALDASVSAAQALSGGDR